MSITSQGGIVMFGPQFKKGTMVNTEDWHPHRMVGVDLGVGDDQRVFGPEVGGRPTPGGAYKGGVAVGGSLGMYPRLESSLGWLLYAQMGKLVKSTPALVYAGVLAKTKVTAASQVISTNIGTIPTPGAKLCVRIYKSDSVSFGGKVTVTLTGTGAKTEDFDFTAGPTVVGADPGPAVTQRVDGLDNDISSTVTGYECIVGDKEFASVTSVTIPAVASIGTDEIYVSVGYEDAVGISHEFGMDPDFPNLVPWIGVRKYYPKSDDPDSGLGETYYDCKVISSALVLPNDGLVSSRLDILGCKFDFETEPDWADDVTYEDFDSTPISSAIGGYINIPYFGAEPMAIVNANFSWVNAPGDQRVERVFGSPYLEDITIAGRQLAIQLTLKWKNPDLYRQIVGNAKNATKWNAKPFTCRLDVLTVSPGLMPGSKAPYSLRIQVQRAMFGIKGSIGLAGNDTVLIPLVGTAIDIGGTYCSYTLTNKETTYTWPTDGDPQPEL